MRQGLDEAAVRTQTQPTQLLQTLHQPGQLLLPPPRALPCARDSAHSEKEDGQLEGQLTLCIHLFLHPKRPLSVYGPFSRGLGPPAAPKLPLGQAWIGSLRHLLLESFVWVCWGQL